MVNQILKEEKNKKLLERKASIAEIVLSFVVLYMLTFLIFLYCHLFKSKSTESIKEEVNAQVSQYFKLAGNEPSESNASSRVSDPD